MIALWMVYLVGTSVLLGLAARAGEVALRGSGRATRWVWVAALIGSVGLPVVTMVTGGRWTSGLLTLGSSEETASATQLQEVVDALSYAVIPSIGWRDALAAADLWLIAGWITASVLVALTFARTWLRVCAARRACLPREMDGERVLLSREWGPAAIGIRHPEVVIPEWLLLEAEDVRRLVVLHEREHVRAGDHTLLALLPLVAAIVPWNPVVWWQLRRLRLAVEVDCDHRVLSRGVETGRYGSLLIDVAGRSRAGALAPALASSRSTLEHRIVAMTGAAPRFKWLRSMTSGVVVATCLAIACATPSPAELGEPLDSATGPVLDALVADPRTRFELDGVRVSAEVIHAVDPTSVHSVEVMKRVASGAAPETWSHVRVTTRAWAASNGLPARVPPDARGQTDSPVDLPEDAVYEIDGRRVDRAVALALEPGAIERVEVIRSRSLGLSTDINASRVRIMTKKQAARSASDDQ